MTLPVDNWKQSFGDVSLYYDLINDKLLNYGPNITWGLLVKQSLGPRFTVIRGEVDFGYTSDQLQYLQNNFPGFQLAPLIAEDIGNTLIPSIAINAPHSLKMSLIPTLPFPKLSFNLTVSHEESQYQTLIAQIEHAWKEKKLFIGGIDFKYSMRKVTCAYVATFLSAEVQKELNDVLHDNKWTSVQLARDVISVVQNNKHKWLRSTVPQGFINGCENEVLMFLADRIIKGFFQSTDPIISFDNGEKLEAVEMIAPQTLVQRQSWTLNKSTDSSTVIQLLHS